MTTDVTSDAQELQELRCKICGNTAGNQELLATENMFGSEGEFRYLRCAACGVLHIVDVPQDLARFYPADQYYSVYPKAEGFKRWLVDKRDRGYVGTSLAGSWLRRSHPNVGLAATLLAVPDRGKRVLDVGCGGGTLLRTLARLGFEHVDGVDPLLSRSIVDDGVRLMAGELASVTGYYDVVMFHHSLEHIPAQVQVLAEARQRLAPGGVVLVCIPTCDSTAFDVYREKWVQLDAPRHLFLHSHRSIGLVAEAAGLVVEKLYCNSQPMQFWASEMYRDGISLVSPASGKYKKRRARFHRELADWLNQRLRGDQIVVHLRAKAA